MSSKIGNTMVDLPIPNLVMRNRNEKVFEKMIVRGESYIVSLISANRINDVSDSAYRSLHSPSMKNLDFLKLKDIDKAVERIVQAKINNEKIGLVTDFDVDGITSAVVMRSALRDYLGFKDEDIIPYVNNRMQYGYGFNDEVLKRVVNSPVVPTLLITADQGSNDNDRVIAFNEHMKSKGIEGTDVIVTDHHHIKAGERCANAAAFVNPQRVDCEFEDKTICGCVVSLLVMAAARKEFIAQGLIPSSTPSVKHLLTYASLATVADCVSLATENNRFIVLKGLFDINRGLIPAWQVLKENQYEPDALITSRDLAFLLAPAINADSRTGGDGSDAMDFLMAENVQSARDAYTRLKTRNNRRKDLELSMVEVALADASQQYFTQERRGLVIYLPKGSHGIHGIVASRVKERFSCPTIIFSPVDANEKEHDDIELTASGRSVEGIDIFHLLEKIEDQLPMSFGGHPMALGVKKLTKRHLEQFGILFDQAVKDEAKKKGFAETFFYPFVEIDHLCQEDELHWLSELTSLDEIAKLEPFGQRFEMPIFAVNGKLVDLKPFGKSSNHLNLVFRDSLGRQHRGVLFNFERYAFMNELVIGGVYTFAFKMEYDSFRNSVGIQIESVYPGMNAVKKQR